MIPFYSLADQEIYNRGLSFIPQERFRLADPFFGVTPNISSSPSGLMSIVDRNRAALNQAALRQASPMAFMMGGEQGGEDDDIDRTNNLGITSIADLRGAITSNLPGTIGGIIGGIPGALIGRTLGQAVENIRNPYTDVFGRLNARTKTAIQKDIQRDFMDRVGRGEVDFSGGITAAQDAARGRTGGGGTTSGPTGEEGFGGFCFDPNTFVQMADGSEKKIKEIQLGDQTKGGEVTGVFQFKASDEIHNYKGVVVAGSHYVKEDGKFIMVQDSPISVKIDKIPVVYSLDTTGRRIFIKDIEFADYNGDGVAKGFLVNAGINVPEFNKEVLRQVEEKLI